VRLEQINREDAVWVQGMNRMRHAYLELAPELEPLFVTSSHDDARGVLQSARAVSTIPRLQGLVSAPGVVAVLDSVVAGAIGGVATLAAGGDTAVTLITGLLVFALTLAGFAALARRTMAVSERSLVVRFPRDRGASAGQSRRQVAPRSHGAARRDDERRPERDLKSFG
jgi:hypothetical protein